MSGQIDSQEKPPTNSAGDLIKWLFRLSVRVRMSEHVQGNIEDTIKTYANSLATYRPDKVQRVIEDWPNRHDWWPTWQELRAELGDPESNVVALPSPRHRIGSQGMLCDRVKHLGIHDAKAWSTIGVENWKHLIDQHHGMTNNELIAACNELAEAHHTQFRSIA